MSKDDIRLREPTLEDGSRLHAFVSELYPLAQNSIYCNILQCTHFAPTCVLAERAGEIVGFVTGYLHPQKTNTYFLWQIGVHERGRGRKLPKRMIQTVLARAVCASVTALEATVSADNSASQAMFASLARAEGAECEIEHGYICARHFGSQNPHDEALFRIAPLSTPARVRNGNSP